MSDFWSGKSVFVTGAGGFVGSWLAKELLDRGARVSLLMSNEDRQRDPRWNVGLFGLRDRAELVWGDLVDLPVLERALAEHEVEAVFHLAAQAIVGVANASPVGTFESNVRGTWNLLDAARTSGRVERIVVASSDKAYGDQDELPYREDFPLSGIYPYDASKACTDIVARSYARTYGLPVAVTRMANIYGGGDWNFSRVVPGTLRSVLLGENPIVRSDGTPVRDYLYVEDAVDAYLTLAERLPDDAVRGEAFNFGTNSPISVIDLVWQIVSLSGTDDLEPDILSPGKLHGEIDRQYLDSAKANAVLGWKAETPMADGLTAALDWYRGHRELLSD
jgi:CDP-glucose 4,6-dehydratase